MMATLTLSDKNQRFFFFLFELLIWGFGDLMGVVGDLMGIVFENVSCHPCHPNTLYYRYRSFNSLLVKLLPADSHPCVSSFSLATCPLGL